jgi:hypothetical protein
MLRDFIETLLPVLIKKIRTINEYSEEFNGFVKLQNKFSEKVENDCSKYRIYFKEFQGKILKIYKIPNDKNEYVKNKGILISIKQYKKLVMKKSFVKKYVNKKIILGKEIGICKVRVSKKGQ